METRHMAHIADFMVETKSAAGHTNYTTRELPPPPPLHDASTPEATTPADEKEKYIWRMHQPTESRKYQLFPLKEKLSISAGRKSPDPETVLAIGHSGAAEKDRAAPASGPRAKPKEQTLVRRRKVSVPELGPMTTVQEAAMDSPTIPGRPPLHERSTSAPNSWRQHIFGESMLSCISGPALDENAEMDVSGVNPDLPRGPPNDDSTQSSIPMQGVSSTKQPSSPKFLPPLVIPSTSALPQRPGQSAIFRPTSGGPPPDVPPKSARMKERSPHSRPSPFTPMSASSTTLSSASTFLATAPNSAPEGRSSPKPWSAGPSPNPNMHFRGQSEAIHRQEHTMGHRRGDSEASIMDRGRPKKRADGSPMKPAPLKRSTSSEEQKAFETLPQGIRAVDAHSTFAPTEIDVLRKQAMGQASRFEVLNSKDVDALSRELRGLDERCEYLRKTHRSLRSGRRNLHDRICTYLRSPRVARFSHESILKQEEALSELDASIDDWVAKLEQADNRRTRIRQKLLEHVAAALIVQPTSPGPVMREKVMSGENTPPRSPTKSQSPQRLAAPLKVDSPQPAVAGRSSAESIRIYADSDVYALLADVEEEIIRMSDHAEYEAKEKQMQMEYSATMNQGLMLNAVTFSPPKLGSYGTSPSA